jgi:hypothetical protein
VEATPGYRENLEPHGLSHDSSGEEMKRVRHFGVDIVLPEGQTPEERLRMMAGEPLDPPSPLRSLDMTLHRLHPGYWTLAFLRRAADSLGFRAGWKSRYIMKPFLRLAKLIVSFLRELVGLTKAGIQRS